MDNLKTALRFPHPPPPLPPPPPPPSQHNLTSRFSAETLVVRSPPGAKAIQRFFSSNSSAHSPPRSPTIQRSFSTSSAQSTSTRPKHTPSSSESHIDFPSPRLYDPEVAPWTRISLDEAEILRSPTVAKGKEWAREVSGANAGGAIGVGKDKLAGAAKEVMELLARKRQGNGHGRKGSSENPSKSPPRKGSASASSSPARPTPTQTRTPSSEPRGGGGGGGGGDHTTVTPKLVVPPPRSDSRNAVKAIKISSPPSQSPHRLAPAHSTPTKPAKSTLRPNSPPSISIPPLHPQPRLQVNALPSTVELPLPPFDALVLEAPSRNDVERRGLNEILVEIDVGGLSCTTTAETLIRNGRGGKLGRFVALTLQNIQKIGEAEQAKGEKGNYLRLPNLTHGEEEDDSSSSLNVTPSHFEISPSGSPFPFMRYSSSTSQDLHSEDDNNENDCCSPIDPLAPQLFLSMPSFTAPPPPLKLDLDPFPASRQVNLVASPAFHSKHLSVHPTISSHSPPLPSPCSPSLATPTPRRMSTTPSPRSFSYHDLPASPNELAARRALAKRLHLSTGSFAINCRIEDGGETFGSDLEPFFEVLRHQAYRSLSSPGSPRTTDSFSKGGAEEFPTDVRESTTEDKNNNVFGSCLERPHEATTATPTRAPEVKVDREESERSTTTTNRRPPSLTRSESTVPTESDYPSSERPFNPTTSRVPRLRIFLDRTDVSLPSGLGTTYSTLLSFLRDETLPPFLTLPAPEDPSLPIDPTTRSILEVQPSLAFGQLGALRTLEREARWLGIETLVKSCQVEHQKWVEALRIVEAERARVKGPMQDRRIGEVRKKRMDERKLEGWI